MATIASRFEEMLEEDVETRIVVSANARAPALGPGTVLLDPDREAHETYGAKAEALYLIRPDGYVGLRGQPARGDRLLNYLRDLLYDFRKTSMAR